LKDINKAKSLWGWAFYEFQPRIPILLERPLEHCTAHELEKFLVQDGNLDMIWNNTRPATCQEISFDPRQNLVRPEEAPSFLLLPGGRWLLALWENCAIDSWDLDASPPHCYPLISTPPQVTPRHASPVMEYYIRSQEDFLTLDLAVFCSGEDCQSYRSKWSPCNHFLRRNPDCWRSRLLHLGNHPQPKFVHIRGVLITFFLL
jgi:hypothetical protein